MFLSPSITSFGVTSFNITCSTVFHNALWCALHARLHFYKIKITLQRAFLVGFLQGSCRVPVDHQQRSISSHIFLFLSGKMLVALYHLQRCNTWCPPKNAPTLQCHIFKMVEFDVFKFSTVIQHELIQCIERFDGITSFYQNSADI